MIVILKCKWKWIWTEERRNTARCRSELALAINKLSDLKIEANDTKRIDCFCVWLIRKPRIEWNGFGDRSDKGKKHHFVPGETNKTNFGRVRNSSLYFTRIRNWTSTTTANDVRAWWRWWSVRRRSITLALPTLESHSYIAWYVINCGRTHASMVVWLMRWNEFHFELGSGSFLWVLTAHHIFINRS